MVHHAELEDLLTRVATRGTHVAKDDQALIEESHSFIRVLLLQLGVDYATGKPAYHCIHDPDNARDDIAVQKLSLFSLGAPREVLQNEEDIPLW